VKLTTAILASLTAFALTACGDNNNTPKIGASAPATPVVEKQEKDWTKDITLVCVSGTIQSEFLDGQWILMETSNKISKPLECYNIGFKFLVLPLWPASEFKVEGKTFYPAIYAKAGWTWVKIEGSNKPAKDLSEAVKKSSAVKL